MLPVPERTSRNRTAASGDRQYRVLVADDHPVVRMGAATLLQVDPDIEVIAEAASCSECCARAAELRPDIVVLDLEMGDCRSTEALHNLLEACPDAAVVVYTAYMNDHLVRNVVNAGARGFVTKGAPPGRLVDAVRAVAGGQVFLDPAVTAAVVGVGNGHNHLEPLTGREEAVLGLLAQGKRNKEISRQLFISERTVKFHVSALMQKLGASNRTEAVRTAIEAGIVTP
jgi:DNA-binding NarL/FixJ family response regulator